MLCRVLLHAVNLQHGTSGFTSPPKEVNTTNFLTPIKIHCPEKVNCCCTFQIRHVCRKH
jgi:hypothetical protein